MSSKRLSKPRGTLRNLKRMPLYLQGDNSYCVPYSLTCVAHYFGIGVDVKDMITLLASHKTQGTQISLIPGALRKIGLNIKRLKFTVPNVAAQLKNGKPVVICYLASDKESHFTTIVKVRTVRGIPYFTMNDTIYGLREMPAESMKVLMGLDESYARVVEKK